MLGYRFTEFVPDENNKSTFEKLLDLFMEILNYTAGDVAEALSWLNEIDRKYRLTGNDYGMGDFIEELREKGYIKEDENGNQDEKVVQCLNR